MSTAFCKKVTQLQKLTKKINNHVYDVKENDIASNGKYTLPSPILFFFCNPCLDSAKHLC